MKTLQELKAYVSSLPCGFAEASTETIPTFPTNSTTLTNFEDGITAKYSTSPSTLNGYVLRGDMMRIGEMASRELHYRQVGGKHTYAAQVSSDIGGYPYEACLKYFDGEYLKTVESQESANNLDFVTNPKLIDNLTKKTSDPSSAEKRILWKTCNRIYGVSEDLLRLNVDFSRQYEITDGESLTEDSLVLVGADYNPLGTSSMSPASMKVVVSASNTDSTDTATYTISLSNKGKCGLTADSFVVGYQTVPLIGLVFPVSAQYISAMCGVGNYDVGFFAKAGAVVTAAIQKTSGAQKELSHLTIVAFPLLKYIGSQDDE